MPPARRKGTNRPKGNAELQLGDLVLAKVKGFPPWPAKICRPEDWDKSPDPKKYFVEFFGTAEIAFVAPADIQIFTNESKSKLAARCQGKTVKYFSQAVKEICEAFEKLQKTLNDSGEGAYVGTVSTLAIGVEGKNLDNNEMNQLEVQKQVFQKSINDKPFGSIDELPLEPCTHSRGTMVNESSDLNDTVCESESPILSFKRRKPSTNNKKSAKDATVTTLDVAFDGNIPKEETSYHSDGSHKNAAESCQPNDMVEASLKDCVGDKHFENPSCLAADVSQAKEEGKSRATASEIYMLKGEVDADKLQMGQGLIKKLPNGSSLTCTFADSSLDVENIEMHAGTEKEHSTLKKSKKKLPKGDSQNNGPINEKPVISEPSTLCRVSIKTGEKVLISSGKHKLATMEELPLPKRSKAGEKGVYLGKSSTKGQLHFTYNNNNKKSIKNEILESMKAGDNLTSALESHGDKKHLHPEKSTKGSDDPLSLSVTTEDSSKKTRKRSYDVLTTTGSDEVLTKKSYNGSNKVGLKPGKAVVAHHVPKKRALRYVDDDDDNVEDCRTPVHKDTSATYLREHSSGSSSVAKSLTIKLDSCIESSRSLTLQNADKVVRIVSSRTKERENDHTESPHEAESDSSARSPCNVDEKKQENAVDLFASQITVENEGSPVSRAAIKSLDTLFSSLNGEKVVNEEDSKFPFRKGATSVDMTQIHSLSKTPVAKQYSHSQSNLQKNKSSLEKSRVKPGIQSNVFSNDRSGVNFSVERTIENEFLISERPDVMKDNNSIDFLSESKMNSATSMKHLIAAAQAKRRQAHSQHLLSGNSTPGSAPTPHGIHGRSPSHISSSHTFSSDFVQKDKRLFQFSAPAGSPQVSQRFDTANLEEHEECDCRSSMAHLQPGNSLSGGTEAAVARDALEGMIETLSRTRDSIGRASRLAIDCAKYGIASEVVELLVRKLEGEPSLHRRIDLFFLVDSITQCSHTQKGIAGASYIPSVQAALPRLLGAAAPPGASARENRRQCLKVLRLWMERKILPESLLRRCMEEIEVPCEDLSSGVLLRRPSRAERSVDDPIREMEGMLVDEYGSNTTFQFPGLMSAQVLEDDDDCTCSPFNDTAVNSTKEALSGLIGHLCRDEPVAKHHHILEHVEQEMEMEDVPVICQDENLTDGKISLNSHPDGECNVPDEYICNNESMLPQLPAGSPPLPLDPPPLPPPLPPSPPPLLPPLPSSPPPQPPPPPPISPQLPPPPPPPPPPPSTSLAPQLRILSETSVIQPPLPSSPCPYRNHPSISQEYCRPEIENQVFQATNKSSIKDSSDYGVKADVVMQQSPNVVNFGLGYTQSMPGASSGQFDVGQHGMYIAPQVSHSNQLFQQSIASTQHRPLHSHLTQAISGAQTPLNHPSYGKPMTQQQSQQHYNPYTSSHSHGQQHYNAEEQQRLYPADANPDNPGAWMVGGRTPCLSAPFRQEGYLRSNVERTSSHIIHHPQHNSAPSGTSLPGHGFTQMMSRADFSTINFWRPT